MNQIVLENAMALPFSEAMIVHLVTLPFKTSNLNDRRVRLVWKLGAPVSVNLVPLLQVVTARRQAPNRCWPKIENFEAMSFGKTMILKDFKCLH